MATRMESIILSKEKFIWEWLSKLQILMKFEGRQFTNPLITMLSKYNKNKNKSRWHESLD